MESVSDRLIHLLAPAKLTTSLRVVGLRDDGYHLIDAEMVSLDVGDTITIDQEGPDGVVFVNQFDEHVDIGPGDLVSRALEIVQRRGAVTVRKVIPPGAGLGGGSSDAAAILHWAGMTDANVAAGLGADVAFCVLGGRVRVQGIGELLTPLPFEQRTFTLLTPPVMCSTPAVYRAWDELGGPTGEWGNDLEPAALVVAPELVHWRDELHSATGERPRLAGSGSTWFVEGEFPGDGRVVARTIPARIGPASS